MWFTLAVYPGMTSNPPAFTSKPWDYRKHYCAWYYVCWGLTQSLYTLNKHSSNGVHFVCVHLTSQADLDHWTRPFPCLSLPSAEIAGVHHHTTLLFSSCINSIEKQNWQDELYTQYILYVDNIQTLELIECLNLQVVVWLSQQWLSSVGKSKNLTLFGSRGWMSPMVFSTPVRVRANKE